MKDVTQMVPNMTTTELTKNQRLVLAALSRAGTPLSAYQILDQLRDDGFRAPLQVYRALDQLRGLGVVHRLESMNAFVACAHADGHPHHGEPIGFTICERCGAVSEIHDADFRAFVDGISARSGFRPKKTTVEIRGICAECAKAA
jgi:Fur family zinc uptake transcriptional regulator